MKKKIVFFCESVTLAHVARTRLLADHIDRSRYDIVFYCDAHYEHLFSTPDYPTQLLYSTTPQQFIEWNLKSQPIWGKARIDEYLRRENEILELEKPDVVVGDMRHTLQISAKKHGVPYINILNGYWGAERNLALPIPDVFVRRVLGTALAQRVFDLVKPVALIPHTRPFQQARQQEGLPALTKSTLPHIFCECDYLAYLDLPEIVDMDIDNERKFAVGPVLWSPQINVPSWWDDIPTDKPIVYINLGSSGDGNLLPALVAQLAKQNLTLIVGTADKNLVLPDYDNVFQSTYVPGDLACERADVCISNGGSPTAMQALAAEVFCIGICFNIDQLVNMQNLKQSDLGDFYYPTKGELAKVEQACMEAINNKRDLKPVAQTIQQNDPYAKFNHIVDKACS